MRLGYITSAKRGLPTFVYHEVVALKRHGIEVVLLTTKYGKGLYMPESDWPVYLLRPVSVLLRQPIMFALAPFRYAKLLLLALRTGSLPDFLIGSDFALACRSNRITSLHCKEGLHSLSVGYYVHRFLSIPLSVTIYADALYIAPNPGLFVLALQACERIITVCEFNKSILMKQLGIAEDQVEVIPIHLDAPTMSPAKQISVLIVGQYAERKGHEVLFEAIRQLNRKDIVVWVVGGSMIGGESNLVDVPGIARHLGIADQVIFFGNVTQEALWALYRQCDIFCLPSRFRGVREGTPVALMEAMSFERPVISTRHAGIPEYVEETLVDEDDAVALAEAISYLADHPEERVKQGRRNRQIVLEKFSVRNTERFVAALNAIEGV